MAEPVFDPLSEYEELPPEEMKERAVELYREALGLVPDGSPLRRDVMRRLVVATQAVFHLPDAANLRPGEVED